MVSDVKDLRLWRAVDHSDLNVIFVDHSDLSLIPYKAASFVLTCTHFLMGPPSALGKVAMSGVMVVQLSVRPWKCYSCGAYLQCYEVNCEINKGKIQLFKFLWLNRLLKETAEKYTENRS